MNRIKSDFNASLLYAILMTLCYLLGNHVSAKFFGFGVISLPLLSVVYIFLVLDRLKNSQQDIFYAWLKCHKITTIACGLFLFLNIPLSILFNHSFEVSLNAIFAELPRIVSIVIIYGIWMIFSSLIVLVIFFVRKRKVSENVLDDNLIDKT